MDIIDAWPLIVLWYGKSLPEPSSAKFWNKIENLKTRDLRFLQNDYESS